MMAIEKVKTKISVEKSLTLDEGELEDLLIEYARKRFNLASTVNVTVSIECQRGYVSQVTIMTEDVTTSEE